MKNLQLPKAIFFDWDGTLVDSYALILAAHNFARAELDMSPFTSEDFRPYFGKPREFLYKDIYGDNGDTARGYFEEFVASKHSDYITAMAGAAELLACAKDLAITIGIVSNKRPDFIRQELDHLEWADLFISVVGAAEAKEDKPSPEPLYLAIERSGKELGAENIWYVGDTEIDMECALNAGCTSIYVSHGSAIPNSVHEYKPSLIIENCGLLKDFLLQCSQK